MSSIPSSLTDRQRIQLLTDLCSGVEDVTELADFVERHCPALVDNGSSDTKRIVILALPVHSCAINVVADLSQITHVGLGVHHDNQHWAIFYQLVFICRCYCSDGLKFGKKYSLRCKKCKVTYNYSQYGDKSDNGFRYYPMERDFIEASDVCFFERTVNEFQCCLA